MTLLGMVGEAGVCGGVDSASKNLINSWESDADPCQGRGTVTIPSCAA